MPETIAVLSQKGGTGKTTTVRTLTDVFRRIGLSVLAVDLDPQGNLSDYLDVPRAPSRPPPPATPPPHRRAATGSRGAPRRAPPSTTG